MLLKLNKIAIIWLLAMTCLSVEARRRSRIDLPIQNAADAPLEDNLATASGVEKIEAEKLEAPAPTTVPTEIAEEEKVSESNSSEESPSYDDCDLDNISFEMITG